jgi:hypothetical protein
MGTENKRDNRGRLKPPTLRIMGAVRIMGTGYF